MEKAGVETTKGWQVSRESDGKCRGRVMESVSGEDGKRVGREMWDCAGWELWGWEQGKARVRAREEPMVL